MSEPLLPLDTATKLAIERTRVAYERTIMAAIRTATSLITFGFTVQRFFQSDITGRPTAAKWLGPYEFGILMILMGLVSLLFAWVEYSRDMKSIRRMDPTLPRSTAGIVAAMLGILGLVLLILSAFQV
ncbi:MAG: YidH family protein [Planctomycetota bacterium]|jgi:putative membrane protein